MAVTYGTIYPAGRWKNQIDAINAKKGAANGFAELDANGKVPTSQLPSYVDDVVEYNTFSAFPQPGESGKIYIALDTNLTYRWGGSEYVIITASVALGETAETAYRGDRGKIAYDHATDNSRLTTAQAQGLYKVGVTAEGHVSSVTPVTKTDITNLGIVASLYDTQLIIAEYDGTSALIVETTFVPFASGDHLTPGFVTSLDYDDIIKAFKAGKNVIVHLPYTEPAQDHEGTDAYGIESDQWMQIAGYADPEGLNPEIIQFGATTHTEFISGYRYDNGKLMLNISTYE